MRTRILITCISASLINLGASTLADAALSSRLDGKAYYDDVLNITWLADANFALTSGYQLSSGDYDIVNGKMLWEDANNFVADLSIDGITGWRLPTMIDTGNIGCDYSDAGTTDCGYNVQTGSANTVVYSELASLWTDTLGNIPKYDTEGNERPSGDYGLANTGPFSNIQEGQYWTGLEYNHPNNNNFTNAWYFNTNKGLQNRTNKDGTYNFVWAVHSGDVNAVPVPASLWLFGSGLLGLISIARRKNRNY